MGPASDGKRFFNAALSRDKNSCGLVDGLDHDEEDGTPMNERDSTQLTAIEMCRSLSNSAWFHFPHIELLFLMYAFEGAVGAQASAIRRGVDASAPAWVIYAAIGALVRALCVLGCANTK